MLAVRLFPPISTFPRNGKIVSFVGEYSGNFSVSGPVNELFQLSEEEKNEGMVIWAGNENVRGEIVKVSGLVGVVLAMPLVAKLSGRLCPLSGTPPHPQTHFGCRLAQVSSSFQIPQRIPFSKKKSVALIF